MTRSFVLSMCLILIVGVSDAARKRTTLTPDPGVYSDADIKEEILFGREMSAIILASKPLVDNQLLAQYVNLVGQSIVRHSNRQELQYYFAVIESNEINAYATPGGYIFITSAALKLMHNEAELAVVLAHEIAHVSERHIVKSLNIREADDSMIALLGKVIGSRAETANIVYQQAVDHAVDLLFSSGLAIQDEFEADKVGTYLTVMAGYDPAAMQDYLERIKPVIKSSGGEMSNTHPPFFDRIGQLTRLIEDEGLADLENDSHQNRFSRYTQGGN